jgi:hypothetical protein
MPALVTDPRSNANEQIVHAAEVIGKSKHRAAIFDAVCSGRAQTKAISDVVAKTRLPRQQVLNAAKQLVDNQIVHQTKKDGETAYQKDAFYARHKKRILNYAKDPSERQRVPTMRNPAGAAKAVTIKVPRRQARARYITVEDVDSFARVKKQAANPTPVPLSERRFKNGMKTVVGEDGKFEDWGGEGNDLWTTRVRFGGKRRRTAFAFKGMGTRGSWSPAKWARTATRFKGCLGARRMCFWCSTGVR